MLSWLVRRVVKDAWFVVVTWAVLAIVLLTASLGILGGRGLFERLEAGTLSVGGTESAQGDQIISVLSGDGRIVTLMVEGIDISSPEAQAQVAEALGPAHTELASLAGATNVFDPFNVRRSLYASAVRSFGSDRLDGFLVVVSVDPNGTEVASPDDQAYAAEVDRIVERVEDRLRQIPGELSSISPQVSGIVSDDALKADAVNDQARRDLLPAVLIAVLAPLVMMILILGRVRAAAAPALGALVSLAGSLGILWALSLMMKVQAGTVGVITAVGLSLSIGYGLLIACRYQEELVSAQREEALDTGEGEIVAGAHRRPRPGRRSSLLVPAMQAAVSTTGRTMILSGVLVAACMIPLLLMGSDALRATGLAGIAVVLLCVTVSLTAVPAVLSLLGEAMRRPTILQRATAALRSPRPGQGAVREEGVFSRLASLIHRLPWVVLVAGAVLLVILASPARHLHMLTSTDDLLPAGSDQQAYRQMLLEHYPVAGQQEDAAVVIAGTGENVTNFINSKIATTPGVDKIQRTATAGKYTVAYLDLAGPASGGQAEAAVRSLRALEAPADTWVTGQAASQVDFADAVVRSLLAVGAAMLTVLVMLCLVTGSILVPVKTLIVNVLSVAASLGMVVWVFQQGHAAGLLGFTPLGGVEAYAVVTAACAGLGLSTGYSVFSLGRIKERWQEGYDNNRAVELGLQRSGRTLTSMALVMTVVFLGFVTGKTLIVKEAALILALTVVIDAVVVRVLLLPAAMALLGRWNWWMPRALRQPNGRYGPEPTAAQATAAGAGDAAAAGAITVGAAGDAATGAAVGAAGTAAGDAGAAGTSDAAAAGAGYVEGDHDAFTGPGAAEPITAAGPGAAEPADWAAAPVEPAAPPDWSDRAGPEASADASAFDDWQAASADGSAPLYGSAPVGSPAAPDWQAPDDWAAASDGGPAAPADGSAPVYGSGPEGGPAVPDWQASIDFPGPDGPAAPSDWSVPASADGSAPTGPWSPDQPYEVDAPRDADRADRDPEGAEWATGASPASADWSAEPLVAPVDFSVAADPLALPDWSISTGPAAAPGSAPAAEDPAIDDTLSTNGPLATEDTLATSGPLATGGPSATDWSVPTGPWTPDRPQEAGTGYGGVGEDDWDPEGAEQAADDQDRRYGPNPHLAADETDPPWEGRPE
ncbi:MMPL family transporter [Actinomyces dentalis]|uniref:MMPL family transporter n=1 Tax=Actinomyces dentalis TaxID=272548 RepID=UPI0028E57E76|nr:MMPL family transporter [Actinomyces dentalis]